MATKQKKTKPRRRGGGFAVKIILLLLLAGIGWQLHDLQKQVKAAEAEKARYAAEVESLRQENDALAADIAEGTTPEKMEEIARKELGVVTTGEYVFSHRGS